MQSLPSLLLHLLPYFLSNQAWLIYFPSSQVFHDLFLPKLGLDFLLVDFFYWLVHNLSLRWFLVDTAFRVYGLEESMGFLVFLVFFAFPMNLRCQSLILLFVYYFGLDLLYQLQQFVVSCFLFVLSFCMD